MANVYTINKSSFGLKSDLPVGSRVTLFAGLLTVDPLFSLQSPSGARHKKKKKEKKEKKNVFVQANPVKPRKSEQAHALLALAKGLHFCFLKLASVDSAGRMTLFPGTTFLHINGALLITGTKQP